MAVDTQEVLRRLDGLAFIRSVFPQVAAPDQGGEVRFFCPFHEDKSHPSASFNVNSKIFRCFSCPAQGSAVDLLAKVTSQSRHVAAEYLAKQLGVSSRTAIEPGLAEGWHQALKINSLVLESLRQRKGLDLEAAIKWRLGWNEKDRRLTIPVTDETGSIINVRQYDLLKVHDPKFKFLNAKGHGQLELFPKEHLKQGEEVFIAEGELKMIGLHQRGFNAVTTTGGAAGWKAEWDQLFAGKKVRIVYDVDETGTSRARALARRLLKIAAEVKVLMLPLDLTKHPHGDVLDYFASEGYQSADLRNLELGTPPFSTEVTAPGLRDDLEYEVDLASASKAQYYLHKVKVPVIVSAKDTAPYVVPRQLQVNCTRDQEICAACPIFSRDEQTVYEIEADDHNLLQLIDVTVKAQNLVLKALLSIPAKCQVSELVALDSHNLEELRLVPQMSLQPEAFGSSEHTVAKAYHVGHGIETNATYEIKARCAVDPTTQHATLLIYEAKPNVDSLSSFSPSAEELEELKKFQPEAWTEEKLEARLQELYRDLELNVTRVYERRPLHELMDLVWHSVLYVTLDREPVKGWVDALVIGDSGQGKSETALRLLRHYGLGERVDMKGASVAGLKGGLQDTQNRWFVTWGVIPLADRRMAILEEVKGCPPEVLQSMTDMRSSGVAEIVKIERRRAYARTRLLWISNPRSDRKIDTYSFGVQAIKELMGSLEDVRRFDAALVVSSNEVDPSIINRASKDSTPHEFTSDRCRRLVLWAWSRRPEQVVFQPDAKEACIELANRHAGLYSSSIPLVEPADHRLKLSRLAAALAARTFSTDDGQVLVVRRCHVERVGRMLEAMYNSRFMGYDAYSQIQQLDSQLTSNQEVDLLVKNVPHAAGFVRGLTRASAIRQSDIDEWSGCGKEASREILAGLVRANALQRKGSDYYKTGAFIEYLKKTGLSEKAGKPAAINTDY